MRCHYQPDPESGLLGATFVGFCLIVLATVAVCSSLQEEPQREALSTQLSTIAANAEALAREVEQSCNRDDAQETRLRRIESMLADVSARLERAPE